MAAGHCPLRINPVYKWPGKDDDTLSKVINRIRMLSQRHQLTKTLSVAIRKMAIVGSGEIRFEIRLRSNIFHLNDHMEV